MGGRTSAALSQSFGSSKRSRARRLEPCGPSGDQSEHEPGSTCATQPTYISCERTRNWAVLPMRATGCSSGIWRTLSRLKPAGTPSEPNVRAMLMHRVFGEMYQLKTLSGRLFQMPLSEDDAEADRDPKDRLTAGPPFELPSNMRIPVGDIDCWCMHRDALLAARDACNEILKADPTPDERDYIDTLLALDEQTEIWIDQILAGLNSTTRYSA